MKLPLEEIARRKAEAAEWKRGWEERLRASQGSEKVEATQERMEVLTLLDQVMAATRGNHPAMEKSSPWHKEEFERAIQTCHPDNLPLIERVLEELGNAPAARKREAKALLNKVTKRSA